MQSSYSLATLNKYYMMNSESDNVEDIVDELEFINLYNLTKLRNPNELITKEQIEQRKDELMDDFHIFLSKSIQLLK